MTEKEFISMVQSTLGRLRCDLVVAATAMKDNVTKLGPPWASSNRLLVAAELIEKTQDELSAIERQAPPPLPVPGPGSRS